MFDVVIIGGGPAGMMAAIQAAKRYNNVLILEKKNKLGTKLLISGGGRCNLTNNKSTTNFLEGVCKNNKFMYSAIDTFGPKQIINYFRMQGIELKEEDLGRMFPVSNKALTIQSALENSLLSQGVQVRYNCHVTKVDKVDNAEYEIKIADEIVSTSKLIIAVGGMAHHQVGTTGDGYAWAKNLGYKVNEIYPCEVPLVISQWDKMADNLQGTSFKMVRITSNILKNRAIDSDLIFTHFGISGPAALKISSLIRPSLNKGKDVSLTIDFIPTMDFNELQDELKLQISKHKTALIRNVIKFDDLSQKYMNWVLSSLNIDPNEKCERITKADIFNLVMKLKKFEVNVQKTLDFSRAFVTGGGINVKQINPKTMLMKSDQNLSFIGEVIDVHGFTGGYNITIAFATGYAAGTNI